MGLLNPDSFKQITADTNDIYSGDLSMQNAGPGVYDFYILAAAAADGTFTINDGVNDIVSARAIPVKAAAVTYPELVLRDAIAVSFQVLKGLRPIVNIVDGTNAEIVTYIRKR